MFFCFVVLAHSVTSCFLFIIFPKLLWGFFSKNHFLRKMSKLPFKKHYKIMFLKGVFLRQLKKTWFTQGKKERHQTCIFKNACVFLPLKPLVFCRHLVFQKCPFLCPLFGGNTNWTKWCTLFFLHNFNRTNKKNSETTIFLQ